jgi:hypothetical protein
MHAIRAALWHEDGNKGSPANQNWATLFKIKKSKNGVGRQGFVGRKAGFCRKEGGVLSGTPTCGKHREWGRQAPPLELAWLQEPHQRELVTIAHVVLAPLN